MIYIFLFILGSLFGSFFNVCIRRLPKGESIIKPASHCMQCGRPLAWYDNIPLASCLLLRGRCRHCRARIPFQYFVVELVTALALVILFYVFGLTTRFFIGALFTGLLIIGSFADLNEKLIPDQISLGGLGAGLAVSFFQKPFYAGLLGAAAGAGLIYILGALGGIMFREKIKREKLEGAMGGGDVKLMAMIGAFLGWKLVILVFFLAPFLAVVPGLVSKFMKKTSDIAYGPYLAMAAIIALVWGERILRMLMF